MGLTDRNSRTGREFDNAKPYATIISELRPNLRAPTGEPPIVAAKRNTPRIAREAHHVLLDPRGLPQRVTLKARTVVQLGPERRSWRTLKAGVPVETGQPSIGRFDPIATSARRRSRGEARQPAKPSAIDTVAAAVQPPTSKDTAAATEATYASGTATNTKSHPAR